MFLDPILGLNYLQKLSAVLTSAYFFPKLTFTKNSLRNTRVSNSLDPDQAQHFVKLGLGPFCLFDLIL